MRDYDDDPVHAHILLRVFDIDGESTSLKIFPNPWSLYMARVIDFRSIGEYQAYEVDESEQAEFHFMTEEN